MRDYQELVDILQSVLAKPDEWDQTELSSLAEEYAEQCRQVNERARQCHQLLRRGQLAEAVRQAELEPRLIDWAGTLQFPERDRWVALCELMGLAVPPTVECERIKDINEAYMLSHRQESLLRLWRYQNLVRAPINERIETLRRLAAANETDLTWQDDIRTFEEAWLKELGQQVRALAKAEDLGQLYRLKSQIHQVKWSTAQFNRVAQSLDQVIQTLEQKRQERRAE